MLSPRIVFLSTLLTVVVSYTPSGSTSSSRSQFLKSAFASTAAIAFAPDVTLANDKQLNLAPSDIAAIVEKDLVENAFLTNGKLTRSTFSIGIPIVG